LRFQSLEQDWASSAPEGQVEGGSLRKPKDASASPGALILRLFAEAERGRTPVNTHPLNA
jgi:hypothetical protein